MHFELLAFYGGPDQVMTVTSGLASLLGLLLIFWNKVVAMFVRILRMFRSSDALATEARKNTPTGTP